MTYFKCKSLKTKITLAVLVIFVTSIWSLAYFASQMLRRDMERLLGEQLHSTAAVLATQINNELSSRLTTLNEVAQLSAGIFERGPAALQSFLEQRPDLHFLFNGGSYITLLDGTAIADYPLAAERLGVNYSDREYISIPLKEGKSVIGEPVMGKKALAPVIVMGVPIVNAQHQVIGVLTGVINLGMPSFLDQITANTFGKSGGYLLVAPQHRRVVTATDKKRIMERLPEPGRTPLIDRFVSGFEGSGILVNSLGNEVLASAKGIPVAGWYVNSFTPTSEAFAPIREMQLRMLFATLLLTLLAGGLTWWMLKHQLSPLISAARVLAEQSQEAQILHALPVTREDEIGQLIGGFNRLLNTLSERENALRANEENLVITLHSISDGVIATDPQQRVTRMNPTAEQLTGWPLAEALGRPLSEIFRSVRAGSHEPLINPVQLAIAEDQAVGLANHTELLSRDGQAHQISDSASLMRNAAGELVGVVMVFRDVSERYRMIQALREGHETLHSILATTQDGYWRIASDGRLLDVNAAYCKHSGFTREALLNMHVADLEALKTPAEIAGIVKTILRDGSLQFETQHRRQDGTTWHVEISATSRDMASGEIIVFARDISERKQAEEKLFLAASVFTHAREGILITATDGSIIDVNDSFVRITGYRRDEVLGKNPRLLSSGRQENEFYSDLWRALNEKGHWYGEIWNRHKNGAIFAAMQTISAVSDHLGQARHFVALFSDITALKNHEKQLEHIAHYDVLTTLPNRVLLADRLHQAMAQAVRRGQLLAVAYLDLDGFKAVNDRYGHETGDQLLITLAERMKQSLRESDTLARLGGDEFVAVLSDLDDAAACVPLLSRLLAAAAQPVPLGENVLQVSASLGVAFYPQSEAVDADQLLRQADQAMYQAKLSGKNRYHIFDAEQDRSVRGHHESIEHIRHALQAREFVLHYQPKVNMRTGEVIGAEALIRWQHPERGLLLPVVFLPVIENHPLAVELGEWVIESALIQMEAWRAAGLTLPVSVNVSARQLQEIDFVGRLHARLAAHPAIRPGDLEIEVLETSALEDLARVSSIIEECQSFGVSFSLDDFGTGYSSLTYLKHLSVGQLKIDQSFVRNMLDDPDDLSILGGVLSLATAFRRQVIAEGVETVEHGTMLLQLGCELAQGYGIARPMPAADLLAWTRVWRPDASWSHLPAVNRDDLPLLFAIVEHRAWILAVEDFLRGRREALPLVHLHCRFYAWLEKEGQAHHGSQASFQTLVLLHRQIHELADTLCEIKACGRNAEAIGRLGELHELRKRLQEQLKSEVQLSQQQLMN